VRYVITIVSKSRGYEREGGDWVSGGETVVGRHELNPVFGGTGTADPILPIVGDEVMDSNNSPRTVVMRRFDWNGENCYITLVTGEL
jgi:hypothetical protein